VGGDRFRSRKQEEKKPRARGPYLVVRNGRRNGFIAFDNLFFGREARDGPAPDKAPRFPRNGADKSLSVGGDDFHVFENVAEIKNGLIDGRIIFGEEGIDAVDQLFARGHDLIEGGHSVGIENRVGGEGGILHGPGFEVKVLFRKDGIGGDGRGGTDAEGGKFMAHLDEDTNGAARGFVTTLFISEDFDLTNSPRDCAGVAKFGLAVEADGGGEIDGEDGFGLVEVGT